MSSISTIRRLAAEQGQRLVKDPDSPGWYVLVNASNTAREFGGTVEQIERYLRQPAE